MDYKHLGATEAAWAHFEAARWGEDGDMSCGCHTLPACCPHKDVAVVSQGNGGRERVLRAKRGTGGQRTPRAPSFEALGAGRGPKRKAKLPPGSWPPSPAHGPHCSRNNTRAAEAKGLFNSQVQGWGQPQPPHHTQVPRGQCWRQMGGEGRRAAPHDGRRDAKTFGDNAEG